MRLPAHSPGSRKLQRQKPMQRGTDIRRLQQILKRLGLLERRVDGAFGIYTAAAVARFHEAFDMKAGNVFERESWQIIRRLEAEGVHRWPSPRRNFDNTGAVDLPTKTDLKPLWRKKFPGVFSISSDRNRWVATSEAELRCYTLEGKLLWRNPRLHPRCPPSLGCGRVFVSAGDLVILNLYTGKREMCSSRGEFDSPVVLRGNTLYAALGNGIHAMDLQGDTLWVHDSPGTLTAAPTLALDRIYFSTYDRHIYCLDDTGDLCWKAKTQGLVAEAMVCGDSMLFAKTTDSWFLALNPLTGKLIWKEQFSPEEFHMPSIHGGNLLAVDYEGKAYFIDPQDGKVKKVVDIQAKPTTSPLLCRERAFVGTREGVVGFGPESVKIHRYLSDKSIVALIPIRLGLLVAQQDGSMVSLEKSIY